MYYCLEINSLHLMIYIYHIYMIMYIYINVRKFINNFIFEFIKINIIEYIHYIK